MVTRATAGLTVLQALWDTTKIDFPRLLQTWEPTRIFSLCLFLRVSAQKEGRQIIWGRALLGRNSCVLFGAGPV